jgi:arylsulfatase A-like enzyme
LAIPLIIAGPTVTAARHTRPAGLVDLVPTILALVGLEPAADVEGCDLFGEAAAGWPRFSELSWQRSLSAITTGGYQLIVNRDSGSGELYDSADRRQEVNLVGDRHATADSLARVLRTFIDTTIPRPAEPLDALTAEQRERLKRLGYLN